MPINKKILEARKKLGKIKPSEMSFGKVKYDYLSEVEITSSVKEIFDELGVVIYPTDVRTMTPKENLTEILVRYCVVDTEDDSQIILTAVGQGMDSSDKGGPKAMTSAYKYALRQLLMIPSPGSDPDEISTEEHKARSATKPFLPSPPLPASGLPSASSAPASGNARDIVIPFGRKYKGETLGSVLDRDRSYIEWIAGHDGDLQEAAKSLL